MVAITLRMWVHAELVTVWSILMDSVENPQKYAPDIEGFSVLERDGERIVRELKMLETLYKEKVSVNRADKIICRELLDHPDFGGKIIIKAVPSSVQNPMAPVDLQYFLELEPKFPLNDKSIEQKGEARILGILAALKEEQQQIREKAEELEKIS